MGSIPQQTRIHYQERMALGSRIQLALVCDQGIADDLFKQLWIELLLFEKRCSRFLPDSELSQFNRAAGGTRPVSPEFRDVLVAAKHMGEITGGLYNPFVLPALQRTGYVGSRAAGHETDQVDDHSTKRVVGVERLEIGSDWARIPYGTALDVGGCGKGYAGDRLAEIALQAAQTAGSDLQGFWFSIGGDVVVYGTDEKGDSWTIYLQPDPRSNRRIGEVTIPTKALSRDNLPIEPASTLVQPESWTGVWAVATSTTRLRRGEHNGKTWHHIINPRTGEPAVSDIEVAVVVDCTLLLADVLASCAIIVGSLEGRKLMQGHEVLAAGWLVTGSSTLECYGKGLHAYDATERAHDPLARSVVAASTLAFDSVRSDNVHGHDKRKGL